ncbi:FGGY family carbohydrate kinase [Planctobacterium marinum]|uniref:FGGY family carbohydrate kinase n=1 Tax=Planctobacterium marinum TaxID=1631968 RepID=UPI001E57B77A|nr:glycerol kinase GlpK [Planctobacterium marinum]MCC2606532.1 glycerol kinase GlpK [Planctobacterium marinum]
MSMIITLDQSTSATKALLFDSSGAVLDKAVREHKQHYPQPGWVEHDAEEIWINTLATVKQLLQRHHNSLDQLVGVSITNQRETVVIFERSSGKPLYPAIVWQCRRSEPVCESLSAAGHDRLIHERSGLKLDPYFSGSKLLWMMDNHPQLRSRLESGEALIGTIDSYLIYRLTQGQVFATDPTNASRTLLYNIHDLQWDEALCSLWQVPMNALPEVRESSAFFGETDFAGIIDKPLPVAGVMGDSQAALFAQQCFAPGDAKATLGTGSSVLLNIGNKPRFSDQGVLTALAWVQDNEPVYAFEGIIINSASTLSWLQTQLGLAQDVAEIAELAAQVSDSGGVYLVPAFSGLGLPHWEPGARAAIVGLSSHSDRRHVSKAALDSIAYQLRDVLDVMQAESGIAMQTLKVDGGPTANQQLMQFTADMIGTDLQVSATPECSALGATMMGLLALKIYPSVTAFSDTGFNKPVLQPRMSETDVNRMLAGWRAAVAQVLTGKKSV